MGRQEITLVFWIVSVFVCVKLGRMFSHLRRFSFLLALLGVLMMNAFAGQSSFYIGGSNHGIYLGKLDTETGAIGSIQLAAEAEHSTFLALSPGGKYLYSAIETGAGVVRSFRIKSDGLLEFINEQPAGAGETCHVSVSPTGQYVLVANYSGSIAVYPVIANGGLGAKTAFIPLKGSGPNHSRQESAHAHSIYVEPQGNFVYACDLGTDEVRIFKLNAEEGSLMSCDPAKVPPGSGPRHLAFHVTGHFVYVVNEMGLTVSVFSKDATSGALTLLETVPLISSGVVSETFSASEIVSHPSGKWLYAAIRVHDSITTYSMGADGKLIFIENIPVGVKSPRSFDIDSSGRWLIAAGQKDNHLASLQIDSITGKLTPTGRFAEIDSPACVLFVPQSGGQK